MKTMLLLFVCFGVVAQEPASWSPLSLSFDVSGTVQVPPDARQRLALPETVAYEFKGDITAKQISKQQRTRVSAKYTLVVRDPGVSKIYLDMKSNISLESPTDVQTSLRRAAELLTGAASTAMGCDAKMFSSTNSFSLQISNAVVKAK